MSRVELPDPAAWPPDLDDEPTAIGRPTPLLTKREVARWLAVSLRTVDGLIATGHLRPYHVGGSRRISVAEVRRYLAEHHGRPEPAPA